MQPEKIKHRIMFENLTPLHPDKRMILERDIKSEENTTGRILDIFSPIGKGQRALIVASPKSGKTVIMQHIAHRSEEHTSELQSRGHLVCRHLLEKKKTD